VKYF
jgi:hypothetical protein